MEAKARCFVCNEPSENLPLIALEFRGAALWICPGHMPSLIHNPAELIQQLTGTGEPPPRG